MTEKHNDYIDIVTMKIKDINVATYNPRDISEEELAGLRESIKKFGFVEPLVFNLTTSTLVGGHQRLKAAELEGYTEVPVSLVRLSLAEEKALNVALNSHTISGKFNNDILRPLLAEIKAELPDVFSALNFHSFDLPELKIENLPSSGSDPGPGELPVQPKSRLGDVWILGNHRVMCGDSTSIDDLDVLVNHQKIDMIFTDPPYNVGFNGRSGKHEVIMNDNLAKEDFENFITEVCQTIRAVDAKAYYVWCNWKFYGILQEKLEFNACIVWAKNVFGLGRGYRHQHEFCLFSGKIDESIKNESDLWEVAKDYNYIHPTQKPVELSERAFKNHPDFINVLDLFGGSGSTLIGAERAGRNAFVMELDAKYVDGIINRWQKFTGKEAILEETGETYANTARY